MPDIINIIKKHKGEKTHQKVAKNQKAPYRRLHTPLTYSELIKIIVNPWGALSVETDHFHKFLDILIFYTK